jgi:hypothetical protein
MGEKFLLGSTIVIPDISFSKRLEVIGQFLHNSMLKSSASIFSLLSYFEKMKKGISGPFAVCPTVCVSPLIFIVRRLMG